MQISKSCFIVSGLATFPPWMVNAGFIVGKEKTLIVDTGGNWTCAQTIYGYAKAVNPNNERIVINTEPHFDHTGGNSFFADLGCKIYGHHNINRSTDQMDLIINEYNNCIISKVRKEKDEGKVFFANTKIANPTEKIYEELKLDLGGLSVNIFFTPGHTDRNISVYLEKEEVLFCGDIIVEGYIPNLEEGGIKGWKIWLESLKKIENLNPKFIVPGHGKVLKDNTIKEEIEKMKIVLHEAIQNRKAPTLE